MYDTARWKQMRNAHIRDEPLCRECKKQGRITAGREVDHIIPHENKPELMWDAHNLQTLCRSCHSAKTMRERGGNMRASILPQWLEPSTKPLMLVCGPPRAGKTTYVQDNADPADLVLDLDVIALEDGGRPLHEMEPVVKDQMLRLRNSRLAKFTEGLTAHPRCWLIATAGSFKQRHFWKSKGATVIVLNPGAMECKDRINADASRPEGLRRELCRAVDRWA